ncbi:Ribose-5-phosphate isomerase A [compost metagenome]
MINDKEYITDNGNLIIDCNFEKIVEPIQLNEQINLTPGVVDNGLFTHIVSSIENQFKEGSTTI